MPSFTEPLLGDGQPNPFGDAGDEEELARQQLHLAVFVLGLAMSVLVVGLASPSVSRLGHAVWARLLRFRNRHACRVQKEVHSPPPLSRLGAGPPDNATGSGPVGSLRMWHRDPARKLVTSTTPQQTPLPAEPSFNPFSVEREVINLISPSTGPTSTGGTSDRTPSRRTPTSTMSTPAQPIFPGFSSMETAASPTSPKRQLGRGSQPSFMTPAAPASQGWNPSHFANALKHEAVAASVDGLVGSTQFQEFMRGKLQVSPPGQLAMPKAVQQAAEQLRMWRDLRVFALSQFVGAFNRRDIQEYDTVPAARVLLLLDFWMTQGVTVVLFHIAATQAVTDPGELMSLLLAIFTLWVLPQAICLWQQAHLGFIARFFGIYCSVAVPGNSEHWPAASGIRTTCAALIDVALACATFGASGLVSSALLVLHSKRQTLGQALMGLQPQREVCRGAVQMSRYAASPPLAGYASSRADPNSPTTYFTYLGASDSAQATPQLTPVVHRAGQMLTSELRATMAAQRGSLTLSQQQSEIHHETRHLGGDTPGQWNILGDSAAGSAAVGATPIRGRARGKGSPSRIVGGAGLDSALRRHMGSGAGGMGGGGSPSYGGEESAAGASGLDSALRRHVGGGFQFGLQPDGQGTPGMAGGRSLRFGMGR